MMSIDNSEAWKQIPPEEKFELMARAHATGVLAAGISIIIFSTIALALKMSAIMWGSIILSPIIFQFASGKAWQGLRPRVMLEYLAARSAARRFAFTEGAKDLKLDLIFRGNIEPMIEREDIQKTLEASIQNNMESGVWIALFKDTFVVISERPGGAILTLGQFLSDKVKLESTDSGKYTNSKELIITSRTKLGGQVKHRITSKYPGALAVFEKKALMAQLEVKKQADNLVAAVSGVLDDEGESNPVSRF